LNEIAALMRKNNRKILFLTADKYPPFRVDVKVLFGKELVKRGWNIHWILQSDKPNKKSFETIWSGCPVSVGRSTGCNNLFSIALNYFLDILHDVKEMKFIKNESYTILIVKDKFISGLVGVIYSFLFNIKFIYWLSFPFAESSLVRSKDGTAKYPHLFWLRGKFFEILLYKFILPRAKHIFVQTEEMKRVVSDKGIPFDKMTAVPMAVDTKKVKYIGYNKNNKKDGHILLYLGALDKFRRIDFLLRVFKIVKKNVPNATLLLVGGSNVKEDEHLLKNEVDRLGIGESVHFSGHLPQDEAFKFVQKADVCLSYIYPSPIFDVGSPTKLLEYMALGKASVVNSHPEQRAVIKESRAGICVPSNEKKFAKVTVALLRDPTLIRQMGLRGRKFIVNNRNYSQTADVVDKQLKKICRLKK
jgi:glycosyltransferase involved in cell wall biosynthesis